MQIAVGGRHHAHVHAHRLVAAHALEVLLLQEAQQLHLHGHGDLAHLVEEQRPSVGRLEAAATLLQRARERAALVAEELRLQHGLRQRRAVELDEGLVGARRVLVDGRRDQLLARAGLTMDEHGGLALGHLRHGLEEALHGRVVADQVARVQALPQLLAQARGVPPQARVLHGARHQHRHRLHVERLGEVVLGAQANGGDGRVHRAERGHDEERGVRGLGAPLLHQREAVDARHLEVREHHIGLERAQLQQRRAPVGGRLHLVPLEREQLVERAPRAGLVVDYENSSAICHGALMVIGGLRRVPRRGVSRRRTDW
jgi:hypothetical protein